MRDSIDRQYTKEWLQFERPQPMYDSSINQFYDEFYRENPVHIKNLEDKFKSSFQKWLDDHELNSLRGYDNFKRLDISHGCTQYIDDIYQRLGRDNVMIFKNDYKYHWRLNNQIRYTDIDTLDPNKELLIAMPFPYYGDVHPKMSEILDRCNQLKIPVHIDAAWVSCCRDIDFDFDHPSIETFCISLSKGGIGGNRIGLRFSRSVPEGALTIMNDFNMNSQSLMSMGIKFMETFGPEYFWKKYQNEYDKVCSDFDLIPTNAIHLAKTKEGAPVGIRPLLRCLL
jgi:hypothetical protein